MVEHCGGSQTGGDYVHTLRLTDIASGWTECVAMRVRDQMLVIEAFEKVAAQLPFAMLGDDSDNDSTFMSQAVFDDCKGRSLEQTRSRAYKKNDQAWVEQKNGAVVRRLVGYGRLSGRQAATALAQLYESSRLYINFFQPSFKLKSRTRDDARVHKVCFAPAIPWQRLVAHSSVAPAIKEKLTAQFKRLDPVRLLQEIRTAQQALSDITAHGVSTEVEPTGATDVAAFLQRLSLAWKEREARPTHRKPPKTKHWWRTRTDPFADAWPAIEGWLNAEPSIAAKALMERLVVWSQRCMATRRSCEHCNAELKLGAVRASRKWSWAVCASPPQRRSKSETAARKTSRPTGGRALRARQAMVMWTMRLAARRLPP